MNLTDLPAFSDNYIWTWDDGARALVVDPGDAALEARGLQLAGILVTHHDEPLAMFTALHRWKDPFR